MAGYKPSYMEEDENNQTPSNPLASQQNTLNQDTASGSSVPGSTPESSAAPAATSTSAQSANIGAGSGQAAQATPSTQNKRSSGMFTNLQKYIKANEGADLAGSIKNTVAGRTQAEQAKLNTRTTDATQGLAQNKEQRETLYGTADQRQEAGQREVNQGTDETGQAVTQQIQRAAGTAGQALTQAGQLGETEQPQNVDLAQQEQTLQQARDFQYGGPSEFKTSDLESKRQDLTGIADASSTQAGRFGLLQQMFGKQGYTQGQQRLDNLLLQGDEASKSKLSDLRKDVRSYSSQLDKTADDVRGQISQEQAATKENVASFAQELGVTSEDLTNDLQNRIGQVNKELEADMADMTQEEKESVLEKLGFGRSANGEFVIGDLTSVGINELRDIFQESKTEASTANFDEYALSRANMLQRLRGQSELGEFDANAQKAGIERGLREGFTGLADYAPTQQELASPQMIANKTRTQELAERYDGNALNNILYDQSAIRGDIQSLMRDGAVTQQGQSPGSALAFSQEKADRLLGDKVFKTMSAADQAKWEKIIRKQGGLSLGQINNFIDAGQAGAQQAKNYAVAQDAAQKQAISNMANYLRNSSSSNRDAFDRNWQWNSTRG